MLYNIVATISFIIRQFFLPNPFVGFDYAVLLNLIVGTAIAALSYFLVGQVYEKGSIPWFGSLLFLICYSILTILLYLLVSWWWIILIVVAIIIGIIITIKIIQNRKRNKEIPVNEEITNDNKNTGEKLNEQK